MRYKLTVIFYVDADSEIEAMQNLDRREITDTMITVQADTEGAEAHTYECENVF